MSHAFTRPTVGSALLAALLSLGVSAHAGVTEISECHANVVRGKAKLVQDLDCSAFLDAGIEIEKGTLDLNGHTLITSDGNGVVCFKNCSVVGPGTITGPGSGINGAGSVRVKDVTISVSGGLGVAAFKTVKLQRSTIAGSVYGVLAQGKAIILDSTITAVAVGVQAGSGSMAEGPCEKGGLALRRSSVTGTSTAYCSGLDAATNCADLVSCRPPTITQSTCDTSCQAGAGVPCPTWGVCSGD